MYIADLHIHSKYSRATSKNGDIPNLDLWARRKGISLVGTGDFTHPAWRKELEETLEPAEDGLYRVKPTFRLPDFCNFSVSPRFIVTGEISCIYKQDGKVRKVHNLILLPSLDDAERLALKLETVGNIRSDGRPILGISSKELLGVTLDVCPDAVFIPAHIWTPHFSVFGAFSGFDTVEECFGDLSPHIRALETGLSSDPTMNRRVAALDGYTMISNSDAHSPAKLGRESNLIDAPLSYPALKRALETGEGFGGTVEFFPEEGKYHLDGHRACHLRLTPKETAAYGGKCPVCGRKITIGVLNRLEQLAVREEGYVPSGAKPFEHLIPLPEAISSCLGVSETSEKAESVYKKLLASLGSEAEILREINLNDIVQAGGEILAEGIRRLRQGQVLKTAGFDGEYGKIELFTAEERKVFGGQMNFLSDIPVAVTAAKSVTAKRETQKDAPAASVAESRINAAQELAADSEARVTAVIAGPGTGKTFTLTERIVRLVGRGVKPEKIAAVTFTVRAAEEMKKRLGAALGRKAAKITVGTFHSICYSFLKERYALLDRASALKTAAEVIAEYGAEMPPHKFLNVVSAFKNGKDVSCRAAAEEYSRRVLERGMLDFDDLIAKALDEKIAEGKFSYLHVDEFQDVNPSQYELIKLWTGDGGSLFAIGDADQAIYSFRGAAADCFGRLQTDYPDCAVVRLTENYRSSPQIIKSALSVIGFNPGEHELKARLEKAEEVRLVSCDSELSEGIFVAKEIARMTGGLDMLGKGRDEKVRSFGDIAVLARTHRQISALERCLRRDDIPCVVSGSLDFLEAPEVCGTLAFFTALLEQGDAVEEQAALFLGGKENFVYAKEKFLPSANGRPRKVLPLWKEYLHIQTTAFDELIEAAHYADMREFLEAMRLGRDGDVGRTEGSADGGAVRLVTLHGAKGLEFPVVFLCGVREGVLPLVSGSEMNEEEERRLFYVGITRAKEELIVCDGGKPSRFIGELNAEIKKERATGRPMYKQITLF